MIKGWDGIMGGSKFKSQCGQKKGYFRFVTQKEMSFLSLTHREGGG